MKIIVLAGGYSNERDVSLNSGAGICRALRDRGHQAYLLDAFLGFPDAPDKLEEVFDLPDGGLSIAADIRVTEPDLDALCSGGYYICGAPWKPWGERQTASHLRRTGHPLYRP